MSDETDIFEEHVPVSAKIAYGSAYSASSLISGIGLTAINIFYLKVLGLDPGAMAISWILFIVWNMINDPLIGILQDKTHTKIGRRIPYLRYGAPFYALAFIWIWFPFTNVKELLFFNHLLMLFVFDTLYSMMGLITYSLPAEMAVTSKERGNIMLYVTAIGSLGLVGSIVIPLIYLGEVPDVEGFRLMMIIFGILSGVVIYLSSYFIKENEYTVTEETLGFWQSIKECFKNKPFLIVEISIFSLVIMQNVVVGYLIFLFDYLADITMHPFNIALLIIGIVIIAYYIIWLTKSIEKFGLKKMIQVGCIIAIIGFVALLFIGLSLNINQFNKLPFIGLFFPLLAILGGLLCYIIFNAPLMADVIDYDETLTGKRRETTYAGINALITKPAVSIGNALFLGIIALYNYDSNISDPKGQDVSVATGVIIAFTLIPAICLIIGVISLKWYPLDGKEWNLKKKELQRIHIQKEKDYIESLKKEGVIKKSRGKQDAKDNP